MAERINIKNRRASFDYEILESFTAGLVLTGTEIKSIRQGKAGLTDTYCMMENKELWVKNMYIVGGYRHGIQERDYEQNLFAQFPHQGHQCRFRA